MSTPGVVVDMLDGLDPHPGQRVLEIGTGTGWNAALASVLGAQNVVSVEIDEQLAEQARAALARAGYGAVRVVTGDGAAPAAPMDGVFDPGHRDRRCLGGALRLGGRARRGRRLVVPLTSRRGSR